MRVTSASKLPLENLQAAFSSEKAAFFARTGYRTGYRQHEGQMARAKRQTERDCASVWFLILERARNLGDAERVAEAEAKLRELGVHIEWRPAQEQPAWAAE